MPALGGRPLAFGTLLAMLLGTLVAAPFHVPQGVEWLALLASYLLGAVPFGWVLARLLKGVDLRRHGSGNIGATNAMRVLGKPLGFLAFALDFGKGWAAPALFAAAARDSLGELAPASLSLEVLCGAAAVIGHVFPIYLGFRGGKAVATGCGAIVAIDPLIFVFGGLVWLLCLFTLRMVSAASMAMAVAFPIVAWQRMGPGGYGWEVVWGTAALAALVLWRHRANVGRILAGTEPRTGQRRAAGDAK